MSEAAARPGGVPLEQATEDELLARAARAMARARSHPEGALPRAIQWAAYDTVMAELDRRAIEWAASADPAALAELRAWLADGGAR